MKIHSKKALTNICKAIEEIDKTIIKSRKKSKNLYFNLPCTFDIEVTNYKKGNDIKEGIVYLWTFAVNEHSVYYGRTIEEFKQFLEGLFSDLKKYNATLVIYVHNLAYEFQFIRKYFNWDNVFLTDTRRPLYCKTLCFEFRCSYMLSNMNLDNFLKNCECSIQKLPYDYNKKRYPWTELSKQELDYCIHDTIGLYEAIIYTMKKEDDTITSIPLTSTGYVRRDLKKVQTVSIRNNIQELNNLTPELYTALHCAFVGGNTHANRMYVNKIISDVNCYDITSSYPFAQLCNKYPIEPFREKVKGLTDIVLDKNFAYLLNITFYNIEIADYFDGMPIISISKCLEVHSYTADNGRIMSADSLTIWITDIEFSLINKHYKYTDIVYNKAYYSRYGEIPREIKSCIYEYFENKCLLKTTDPYLYRKSKEKLNAIYGMSAFDIGKKRFSYIDGDYIKNNSSIDEILKNSLSHGVQAEPYCWGVWTTANARKNLDEMIVLAGDRFIYCDTDSVYVYGEMEEEIETINERIKKQSEKYKVTTPEKEYYIGTWVHDKECRKFKTLGAKKYCYEDETGVHTVTAGVSKKAGVNRVQDYRLGHIFKGATNNAWYNDNEIKLTIEGHDVIIPSSTYIESADYTLGITDNYNALLAYLSDNENAMIFYE